MRCITLMAHCYLRNILSCFSNCGNVVAQHASPDGTDASPTDESQFLSNIQTTSLTTESVPARDISRKTATRSSSKVNANRIIRSIKFIF